MYFLFIRLRIIVIILKHASKQICNNKGIFLVSYEKSSFHENAILTIFPYFLIHGRQLSIVRQVKGKKHFFLFLVYCLRGRILIFPEIFNHLISALKTPDCLTALSVAGRKDIYSNSRFSTWGTREFIRGYPNFYSYLKIFPKRLNIFEMECEYCVYKSLVYHLRDTLSLKGYN